MKRINTYLQHQIKVVNIRATAVGIFVLIALQLNAQEQKVQRDLYFWGYYDFEFQLHKDWNVELKNQIRLNENISRFDYTTLDAAIEHETFKWLSLSATYRYTLKNHIEDGWKSEHQVRGTADFSYTIGNFKLYNRNRFQRGVDDIAGSEEASFSQVFYRNRTRVKYEIARRWDAYAYFEAYWRLGARAPGDGYVYRKRYGAGIDFEVNPRESVRLFYIMDEQVRSSRPSFRYFIGFGYSRTIDLRKS